MVAEISLHHPVSGTNPHVHILCTMRKIDGEKFSAKKPREWNDVGLLVKQRETWAEAVNAALEKTGRKERVDHRSLKAQGIDREPLPKISVAASAMKRKGILDDPEQFKVVRQVRMRNEANPFFKSIKRQGVVKQVKQRGVGGTWWEQSITFMSRVREKTTSVFKSTWDRFRETHGHLIGHRAGKDGPEIER